MRDETVAGSSRRAFSLPGMVREEKTSEVALVERDVRVLVVGDARHGGARLALAAGAEQTTSERLYALNYCWST